MVVVTVDAIRLPWLGGGGGGDSYGQTETPIRAPYTFSTSSIIGSKANRWTVFSGLLVGGGEVQWNYCQWCPSKLMHGRNGSTHFWPDAVNAAR